MVDVAQLAIQVNSGPAVKAAGDLDRLTVSAGKADAAADRLAANAGRVGPAMAGAGQNSRMFAMQLSQVAQQASATGNFVQALAIQLPDMAMGFGAAGIAAGVLASVALPVLASALMSTGEEGKALQESIDALSEATEAYQAAIERVKTPADELIAKYGTLSVAARDFAAALLEIERVTTFESLTASIAELTGPLVALRDYNDDLTENWFRLGEQLDITREQADYLSASLLSLSSARTVEGQAEAARRFAERLLQAAGSYENMSASARAVYDATVQIGDQASEIAGATQNAALSADRLSQRMADAYGMYAATRNMAAELAGQTERAAAAAFALAQQQLADKGKVYSGRGGDPRTSNQQGYGRFQYDGPALDMSNNVIPSRGGGAADQYAADLEALVSSLETERETLDAWYAESQALLEDRRAQEILGTQAHKDALLALEEEYQARLAEVEATAQQQRISDTASFFGSLASIAAAGGQKTAKAVAVFQAIEGTVNAYGAAIKALNTPGLSLPGRFAAYASVLAAGLRGVAAIRQAGGAGGGTGAPAIAAQGATQAQQQTVEYIVRGIDPNAIYTGEMWATIFDGINDEAQRRGVQTVIRVAV